tara:strand:+ start:1671 stop:2840 length:1170 start_codon:yes stop_codon:yes gene_type:complete
MKYLIILFALFTSSAYAQNIDDNFINFSYIQVPLIPIDQDERFLQFEVATDVVSANLDSTTNHLIRKKNAMDLYEKQMSEWYSKMGLLQQVENTIAVSQADKYPLKPALQLILEPVLNATDPGNLLSSAEALKISGFQNGNNGILVSFKVSPIRDFRITYKKTGLAAQTSYTYSCTYYLSARMIVSNQDGTVLLESTVGNTKRTKSLGKYKSTYSFLDWIMKNREVVYGQAETQGRIAAIQAASGLLQSKFGFVNKSRRAEVYSVKKYKDHDYTDVTRAYNKTSEALLIVGKSPDRSGAYDKLKEARDMWDVILEESNLQNRKERINAKISSIIWCNIAEISVWMGDFYRVEAETQKIKNSSIFKSKNHINGEVSFYGDQKNRWKANFE